MTSVTISSVITGIHRTEIGSHREVRCLVINDDSIPDIDPNCMIVKLPPIEDIPLELHNKVSYPKSRNPKDPRQRDQLIKEVAGKKIGNVPARICGLFRRLIREGKVKSIHW